MAEEGVERRLTTILAADVVGYSHLMAADEVGTLAQLKTHRKELLEPKTADYHGRVVKLMGDGTLMEFGSVVDAVHFAVDVQKAMGLRNTDVPKDQRITYRIGINIGDIIVEGDDIYGDGVNVAARLEGLAEPGGICVSRTVFNHVQGKVDLGFDDLGAQEVKNIPKPVQVFKVRLDSPATEQTVATSAAKRTLRWPLVAGSLIVLAIVSGALLWQRHWEPREEPASVEDMTFPLPDKPSIAVLPFLNMSGDPEQEYFADGMAEDLITDLSKISGLFVIARNSSFSYKGLQVKVRQVAEDLGVRYVLEGSVRRAGEQVRINVQLIDATTGGHLWADRYDGALDDIFALQDRVTREIVTALAVSLTSEERQDRARSETMSPEAYDTFLKGWQHYQRQRREDFTQAVALFKQAIAQDDSYGRAYAALAATYWQAWKHGWHDAVGLVRWHDARYEAEQYLAKALRDPTPLAYQVAAEAAMTMGRYDEAITQAKRAVAIDPNDAEGFVALAGAWSLSGQPAKALTAIEHAMRLNPHYPPSYLYQLALAQFGLERYEAALETLERAAALNPQDRFTFRLMLATYGQLGEEEKAAEILAGVDNWYYPDTLTIPSVLFWLPFKNTADAERIAEGLRRVGIPK